MGEKLDKVLGRLTFRRALTRWKRAADAAGTADLSNVRTLRGQARQIRRQIDRFLHVADGRLARPAVGSSAIRKPPMSDWAWRPEIWCGPISPSGIAGVENRAIFGSETTVFHDCGTRELTLRQVRNGRATDLAPYGLRMDVFRFDGSFLSLVIDLPDDAVRGLRLTHIIRLDAAVETERPLEIFARLNIKHGPNSEQIVRELPLGSDEVMVEFDLAYTRMNEKRVERAWIDLIFEGPDMNQIVLRDVTMSRRPRAEI
ncbi:DUF6478 family protein [Defluviimonas sp. SAOS-178_SWC]|uniref:DUF6478 family protein n=1 Tax=Defluviimonas sp. SAOS-178_SWC TaxID=3121287 RepID=UPI0032217A72